MKADAAVRSLYRTDDFARRDSAVHALHPVAKLLASVIYIVLLVSVDKFEPLSLTPFAAFPVAVWILSGLPFIPIARQISALLPFLLCMGILNPLISREPVAGHLLTSGWLAFVSIVCKGLLSVAVMLLFISTTGMDGFARALRTMKVPKVVVVQIMLTYRYGLLLAGETGRVSLAYGLRAPRERGVRFSAWGSLLGHMLLRAFDRAGRVYDAMRARGFDGEFRMGAARPLRTGDVFFLLAVAAYGLAVRFINIPYLLGGMFS